MSFSIAGTGYFNIQLSEERCWEFATEATSGHRKERSRPGSQWWKTNGTLGKLKHDGLAQVNLQMALSGSSELSQGMMPSQNPTKQ